jgi:hypothetical protein
MKKILIPILLFIAVSASAQYRALIEKDTTGLVATKHNLTTKRDTATKITVNDLDTAALTNFDPTTKVNISDTAAMLSNYALSNKVRADSTILRAAMPTNNNQLTNGSNYIINNLGISGGSTIIGDVLSGGSLTLKSTSNATKGKILFGNSVYDEVNNYLGINTSTPTAPLDVVGNAYVRSGSLYTNTIQDYSGAGFILQSGILSGTTVTIRNTNGSPTGNLVDWKNLNTVVASMNPAGVITTTQYKLSALNTAPASATATGTLGEIRITSGYIYVCTATNTWVRAALTTW